MTDATRRPIRRALVSVYDKTDLVELARALVDAGVEIVSTGSTARTIADAGLPVTPVEQLTGFPECLDGRVKTLHPKVHAGLLADLRLESHRTQLAELGVQPFDVLVSNLYPFTATVASGASPDECVEQIDIGGPAMVRSSAKNHASVAVITEPSQYDQLRAALVDGGFTLAQRQALAAAAFAHTAAYDVAVANWMHRQIPGAGDGDFPSWAGAAWRRADVLRYGENPHQPAALYRRRGPPGWSGRGPATARQADVVQQLRGRRRGPATAYDFAEPAVAIIKHANPCGVAMGADIAEAHRRAHACDPVSAFGGVIAANRPVSVAMAGQIAEVFTEVMVAPGYEEGAVEILAAKKNIRLLEVGPPEVTGVDRRSIDGGVLVQFRDRTDADHDRPSDWQLVAGEPLAAERLADLEFAWRAVRGVKSNAILLARDRASVGIGMGQVNRVDSCRLAVQRAGDRVAGRWPPPTRSSPSRTARRSCWPPGSQRSCNRAVRFGTTR